MGPGLSEFEPWEPVVVDPVWPDMERCTLGVEGHTWSFWIDGGGWGIAPVEPCNGDCQWFESHDLAAEDLGRFRLVPERDCPGGWGHDSCDCNYWLRVVPIGEISHSDD